MLAVPSGLILNAMFWGVCLPGPTGEEGQPGSLAVANMLGATKAEGRQYMPSPGALIAGRMLGAGVFVVYSLFMVVLAGMSASMELELSRWWEYPLIVTIGAVAVMIFFGPTAWGIQKADKLARKDGRLKYAPRTYQLPGQTASATVWTVDPRPLDPSFGTAFGAYWVLVASCFVEAFMWLLTVAGPLHVLGITMRDYSGVASRAVYRLNGIPGPSAPPRKEQ